MYDDLDRLAAIVLPRVRDFKGLPPNSFDGRGNYTLGLKDQLVFPEIDYTRVDKIKGMNITITTTARSDEEGRELLKLLGVPFRAQS
jgi:large subunit ribosomal protein L5